MSNQKSQSFRITPNVTDPKMRLVNELRSRNEDDLDAMKSEILGSKKRTKEELKKQLKNIRETQDPQQNNTPSPARDNNIYEHNNASSDEEETSDQEVDLESNNTSKWSKYKPSYNTLLIIFAIIVVVLIGVIIYLVIKSNKKEEEEEANRMEMMKRMQQNAMSRGHMIDYSRNSLPPANRALNRNVLNRVTLTQPENKSEQENISLEHAKSEYLDKIMNSMDNAENNTSSEAAEKNNADEASANSREIIIDIKEEDAEDIKRAEEAVNKIRVKASDLTIKKRADHQQEGSGYSNNDVLNNKTDSKEEDYTDNLDDNLIDEHNEKLYTADTDV